jgi:L-alanine-DL-glutamate epimerase-like enolase superfamily enzyme
MTDSRRYVVSALEGIPLCEGGTFRVPDRLGHGITLPADAEKTYRLA